MTNRPQIAPKSRIVEIVVFDDAQLLDIAGPLQVLASANEHLKFTGRNAAYQVGVLAPSPSIRTSAGLQVLTEPMARRPKFIDTLIVSGGRGVHSQPQRGTLTKWIKKRAVSARRVVSICTGAFLLGNAGLLNGKRVTTHWSECEQLARAFPKARIERDALFVRDGDLWTSGGVTAGIDLLLALVALDYGQLVALAVARDLVVFLKRGGGQSQFSSLLDMQGETGDFTDLHAWISANLNNDLSVEALANRMGMTERTFQRKYHEETGVSPAKSVERLRVSAAQMLLSETKLPIKRIAATCGFGTDETMRRSFERQLGTTPQNHRKHFSSALKRS